MRPRLWRDDVSSEAPAAKSDNGHVHHQAAAAKSAAAVPSSSSTHSLVLALAIGGGLTCVVVFLLSALLLYHKFRSSRTSPLDPAAAANRLQKFSFRELKAATGCFDSDNKLGQGGFGPVYKGTLRSGQVVAVKSLDSASLQGEKEFQNEMSVIGGIRSSHIVGLLGYCAERKKRLLVYEFMASRSLQEALFHESYPVDLSWKMRYKIILDIAQALSFLHECEPAIIHGDIKPSNVLLDEHMCAKIADFGLARLKAEIVDEVNGEADRFAERYARKKARNGYDGASRIKQISSGSKDVNCIDGRSVEEVKVSKAMTTTTPHQVLEMKVVDQTGSKASEEVGQFSFHNEQTDLSAAAAAISVAEAPAAACCEIESRHESGCGVEDGTRQANRLAAAAANMNVNECEKKKSSREWWWPKHDEDGTNGHGSSNKDYTVDWSSCEVKSREWGDKTVSSQSCRRDRLQAPKAGAEEESSASLWLVECFGNLRNNRYWKRTQQQQQSSNDACSREFSGSLTKSREWWKEEYLEELSNKSRELKGERCKKKSRDISGSFDFSGELSSKTHHQREWWSGDLLHWIHRSRGDSGTIDFSGDLNSLSRELRSSSNNNNRERSMSRDRWSGELASRAVSSTTSMRGTVCYTAPEYGGAGVSSEKSDVYSFGVLMLVIVSGRRPLEVVSPGEFERANLTSWARHLAHSGGDVLEMVDSSLRREFSQEQARLCILVALQCLQRSPAARPSMAEVVRIVSGESQLPPLAPEMFSPSPQKQN